MDDFNLSAFINVYLFAGYALFTITLIIASIFLKKHPLILRLSNVANRIVSFSGILYLAVWLFALYAALNSDMNEYERASFNNRLYGPYSLAFWLQPICYVILTQLLWIKWIATHSIPKFIISFLLFFSFEKFVIIVTSMHRDYLPSSWSMSQDNDLFIYGLFGLLIRLMFYAGLCVMYYLINSEFEKRRIKSLS